MRPTGHVLQRLRDKESRRIPGPEPESPIEPLRAKVGVMDFEGDLAASARTSTSLDFFQERSTDSSILKLG